MSDLAAYDRDHVWHPYTSMSTPTPTRVVTSARGVRLTLDDGREVIDGMSSWWCAIHGYRHPVLDAAVRDQLGRMAHVMFGGITHEPAVSLTRRLVELTPPGLEHVFLADSGSVAVEVAIKVALQAQRGRGAPERTRLLTVRGGYHGDTFGAMSVCDPVGGMHAAYPRVLPRQLFAPRPPAPGGDVAGWTTELDGVLADHANEVAAVIVEPLLQGAGGMHVYDVECLRVLRRRCDAHGWLLVLDEIATGFGRTGTMFAAEQAGVVPDVMCVGKALTGGYLTLSAVLTTGEVAAAVSSSDAGVLMHGPTYMGNPLACAVASASIDLLVGGDWAGQVAAVSAGLGAGLRPLGALDGVADVRVLGAVGVVQLERQVDVERATAAALDAGVWLRPFRDLVYAMPPYVTSPTELATVTAGVAAAVRAELG
ncbi:MAG: adenosylmethionine--8-amino-7-oxononanoate transaminase [Nocardioidaceae bacterium]|nr:adenosylmethionine--8-amino-7-oxononanoate transaminase [Nocardioidaceae bacterium]